MTKPADDLLNTPPHDTVAPSKPAELSPLGQKALEWAALGVAVYPLQPGTKRPMTAHGSKDATTNLDQIHAWWQATPDANIGGVLATAGLCAIDLDGLAADRRIDFPVTFTVLTPGVGKPARGFHLYYSGTVATTQNKLGQNIESVNRVVLPPSRIKNDKGELIEYEVVDGCEPVPLPADIKIKLQTFEASGAEALTNELDLPPNIASGRNYIDAQVKHGKISTQGSGGNTRCFKVAAYLYDLALSRDTVLELMQPYNEACDPAFSAKELFTIVASAETNRQNEVGSKASTGDPNEVFAAANPADLPKHDAPALTPDIINDEVAVKRKTRLQERYAFRDPVEEANKPPLAYWDTRGVFPKYNGGATCIVYGDTGVFKTYFLLSVCLRLLFEHPDQPRIAFYAGEGPYAVGKMRVPAICNYLGKSVVDLRDTGRWRKADNAVRLNSVEDMEVVHEQLDAFRPDIIVVDTVSRALAGENTNDPKVVSLALDTADDLHKRHHSLVMLTHHIGKDESLGASGSKNFVNMPDVSLYITLLARDAIKVHVKKMRDGKDGFSVGYRVKFDDKGVPEFLEEMTEAELAKEEKRGITKLEVSPHDDFETRFKNIMYDNGWVGERHCRSADDIAHHLAGPPLGTDAEGVKRFQDAKAGYKKRLQRYGSDKSKPQWRKYVAIGDPIKFFLPDVEAATIKAAREMLAKEGTGNGGLAPDNFKP